MSKRYHFQLLRGPGGPGTSLETYTGKEGELTYDINSHHIFVHGKDPTTRISKEGGYKIALYSDLPGKLSDLTNDIFIQKDDGSIDTSNPSYLEKITAARAKADAKGHEFENYYAQVTGASFSGLVSCTSSNLDFTYYREHAGDANSAKPSNKVGTDDHLITGTWLYKYSGDFVVNTMTNQSIGGNKTFTGNCYFNNTINGTASRAYWGDLAENYKSDKNYPAGTLIQYGGSEEVTIATDSVNGVVSDKPGYLMNTEMKDGLPIVMIGRVKVRVDCEVYKFDRLVLGKTPGVATVDNTCRNPIAIALENSKDQLVLATAKFTL